MGNKRLLAEFLSFIRVETCFFVTGISIAGYALFNFIDVRILYLFAAIFLGTAASYAYNHVTDRKEDGVNNSRLNYFVVNEAPGKVIIAMLFLTGFGLSFALSFASMSLYLLLMLMGVLYSGARIKGIFIAKNVFTGLTIALTFLAGAAASREIGAGAVAHLPFIFIFGFTLNLLGDIRGCEGDRTAKVRTIPLVFGVGAAKGIVYAMSALFSAAVLLLGYASLYALVPFMLMVSFFLRMDDHKKTRLSMLASFIFFQVFAIAMNLSGGV